MRQDHDRAFALRKRETNFLAKQRMIILNYLAHCQNMLRYTCNMHITYVRFVNINRIFYAVRLRLCVLFWSVV